VPCIANSGDQNNTSLDRVKPLGSGKPERRSQTSVETDRALDPLGIAPRLRRLEPLNFGPYAGDVVKLVV
jgi:hypothetical protein